MSLGSFIKGLLSVSVFDEITNDSRKMNISFSDVGNMHGDDYEGGRRVTYLALST